MYLLRALCFSRVLIWVMRVDTRVRAQKLFLFFHASQARQFSFYICLAVLKNPLFLQFHAGMLKDVIHLLCIYSCIGSEVLRAIFPFTLLDL